MNRTKESREEAERQIVQQLGAEQRWDELVREMDRQDENRQQRADYHEVSCREITETMNTGRRRYGKPKDHRQYRTSDVKSVPWEDIIFDSWEEIHQLLSDRINMQGIQKLTAKQKEVLFYRFARGISVQDLAWMWECSDRNILKHIHAGVEKFQKYITPILKARDAQRYPITTNQRWFLEWLENPMLNRDAYDRMLADGSLGAWLENHIPTPLGKEEMDGD